MVRATPTTQQNPLLDENSSTSVLLWSIKRYTEILFYRFHRTSSRNTISISALNDSVRRPRLRSRLFGCCAASPTQGSHIVSREHTVTVDVVGWVPGLDGRGTLDLVLSCVLTMFLCVYSAMHINVPGPQDRPWKVYLQLFKWGLIGLFAPEVVAYAALRQWISARRLGIEIGKLCKDSEEKGTGLWTLA